MTAVAELLTRDGRILFSTGLRDLELDQRALERLNLNATDITTEITPRVFVRRPTLRAWELTR